MVCVGIAMTSGASAQSRLVAPWTADAGVSANAPIASADVVTVSTEAHASSSSSAATTEDAEPLPALRVERASEPLVVPPARDAVLLGARASSESSRARDDARLWAMIGANVGTTLICYGLALGPTIALSLMGRSPSSDAFALAVMTSGAVLAWVVPPIAVTLVGNAIGGRGNFGMALVGHLVGMLVPIVGPFAGSAVGYEWAHRDTVAREGTRIQRARSSSPLPVARFALAPTPAGVSLLAVF